MTARTAGSLTAADLGREVTWDGLTRTLASVQHQWLGENRVVVRMGWVGQGHTRPLAADAPVHVHDDREPEVCHCGRPLRYGFDGDPTHHRGMCADCDAVRCDAYPDDCPHRPLRYNREPDGEEVRR